MLPQIVLIHEFISTSSAAIFRFNTTLIPGDLHHPANSSRLNEPVEKRLLSVVTQHWVLATVQYSQRNTEGFVFRRGNCLRKAKYTLKQLIFSVNHIQNNTTMPLRYKRGIAMIFVSLSRHSAQDTKWRLWLN